MSFEQRDNSGALFKNDRKEQDSHPDYTGAAKIQGREFYMSAWLKESKSGKKFFSFSFNPKLKSERTSLPTGGIHDPRDPNDSIPF